MNGAHDTYPTHYAHSPTRIVVSLKLPGVLCGGGGGGGGIFALERPRLRDQHQTTPNLRALTSRGQHMMLETVSDLLQMMRDT